MLKVLSDLLEALDRDDVGKLLLLDLSAAFDTVDHETLLRRLDSTFCVSGNALSWLTPYLSGREYFVRLGAHCSEVLQLLIGMPQGSVPVSQFFIMYTVDLVELIRSQNLQPHLYADDSQLFGSCRPGDTLTLADRVTRCVDQLDAFRPATLELRQHGGHLGFDVKATTSTSCMANVD